MKRFQARHGLPADGVIGKYSYAAMNVTAPVRLGQLETNLVRLRTMSGDLGPRYVMVNVPAAQIEAVENDRVALRHTAIVGKIDRQTPILNSAINEIIVNPYWNAPESIVRKDIIPLMRKNPQYLAENAIRILGPDGNEIDPSTIDWNTEDAAKFRFRQDPGKINAMASVKINFPNPHATYMHDTPSQGLFNKLMRFDSSGCVRVQNVRDLVTWLLRDTPGWDRQHFEQRSRAARTRRSSSPCRCRSISPTSRPGRRATAWRISATTSTAATASTSCRSARRCSRTGNRSVQRPPSGRPFRFPVVAQGGDEISQMRTWRARTTVLMARQTLPRPGFSGPIQGSTAMATATAAATHSASFFGTTLADADPEIFGAIRSELGRQRHEIELIASENIVCRAVLEAQGSIMTNKYAEGYPGKRYYGGCQFVDIAEELAIERAKKLFDCNFANVQPNSGSQMNQAVFLALLQPGDTFMGLDLNSGGHLTHGSPVNMSGKWFKVVSYGVRRDDHLLDMDEIEKMAQETKPKLILAGGTAYSRIWDWKRFREIADSVGAYLMVDMAHIAGLVAGGAAPVAAAACACGDDDDAQVAARPARRHDPDQ